MLIIPLTVISMYYLGSIFPTTSIPLSDNENQSRPSLSKSSNCAKLYLLNYLFRLGSKPWNLVYRPQLQ